jgi:serine/threonine protein kinase
VNIKYAFQDKDHLYLVLDYLSGGDLRYQFSTHKQFSEETVRFWIGCLITSLEYVHAQGVIHRDIKPENLVLDQEGYLLITDFGIAKKANQVNFRDNSGTPGYMAPEVMFKTGCSFSSDYYPIGIILHECIFGRRPYKSGTRDEIKEEIKKKNF